MADGSAPDVFRAAARVLKPGGVLGVVNHRAAHPLSIKEVSDTGYIGESQVVELAVAAGFQLEATSEINANPRDTKDHPHGVWVSSRPTLPARTSIGTSSWRSERAIG